MNNVGVDVDSKQLVCRIRRSGKDYPKTDFDNIPVGHRKFIKWANTIIRPECVWAFILPFLFSVTSGTQH